MGGLPKRKPVFGSGNGPTDRRQQSLETPSNRIAVRESKRAIRGDRGVESRGGRRRLGTRRGKTQWNEIVERSSRGASSIATSGSRAIETGLGYTPRHLVVTKDGKHDRRHAELRRRDREDAVRSVVIALSGLRRAVAADGYERLPRARDRSDPAALSRTDDRPSNSGLDMSYLRYNDALQTHGYRPYRRECRFLLDLTRSYDEIREGDEPEPAAGIEHGQDIDYEVVEEEITRENLRRFYRTYERVMDRVDGAVYPFSFFDKLQAMDDRLLLLTIRIDGEYAGGCSSCSTTSTRRSTGFRRRSSSVLRRSRVGAALRSRLPVGNRARLRDVRLREYEHELRGRRLSVQRGLRRQPRPGSRLGAGL